jgi:hypothetical protein
MENEEVGTSMDEDESMVSLRSGTGRQGLDAVEAVSLLSHIWCRYILEE